MSLQAVIISMFTSCNSGEACTSVVVNTALVFSWTFCKLSNSSMPGTACPFVQGNQLVQVAPLSVLRAISIDTVVPVGVTAVHDILDDKAIVSWVVSVATGDMRYPVVCRSVKLFHVAIGHPSLHNTFQNCASLVYCDRIASTSARYGSGTWSMAILPNLTCTAKNCAIT